MFGIVENAMLSEPRTLEQIDGQDWGEPETAPTGMVARCLRLRRTPLKDFTVSDLRLMIGQQIGLRTLVPRALQLVSNEPLLEADFYPGDLLCALLHVDKAYWSDSSVELGQLVLIARAVMPRGGRIADECQSFLTEA
ncbi:contact-dependent growth inhibition system immunity protein [Bradyrhizobium symbiodeficiens]|uniref:Contact-dependent growth inhibition system immunity protein n=1 Tax=Bradyrhizobium symbiodeficiens TaxID=1404367 RepID=A0A6G9A4U9_9BRAD